MSRFLKDKYKSLIPYTPGEQPRKTEYIKLNTNESPFPPSKKGIERALAAAERLALYPDPECTLLRERMAEYYGVSPDEVLMTNGSDEILNFAFMAFCDESTPAIFPDITYGFYKVFASLNLIPYKEIPLREDFTLNPEDYFNAGGTVFIANPNAPSGISISISDIEKIIKANSENIVVIDEAYVDFGAESAVKLIRKYDNLLVTQTFSKSRSLAGGRLGMGIASKGLISDLNTIKYSTNPYNVNSLTQSLGIGIMEDNTYTEQNCKEIIKNREYLSEEFKRLGFILTPSSTNFIFAKHPSLSGDGFYSSLKSKGILVRHFASPRLAEYNRITIGTRAQMDSLIAATKEILEEN